MGNKTRYSIAKSDIIAYFHESNRRIFSKDDISNILYDNRRFWRLTESLTVEKFIELLLSSTILQKHSLKFSSLETTRYSWGDIDIVSLALSIRPQAYMSHYSAISHHGLTEQIPKAIYITVEQSLKHIKPQALTQSRIDSAHINQAKLSNNFTIYQDQKIYLLYGRNTDSLGVDINDETNIKVTNLERTLIDITVRPEYSGGIYEVVKAFSYASESVSINKLVSYLKKINYIYPYHQCIGFYMMVSGRYRESQLQLLRNISMPYKFYLTHGIEDKAFSKEWNLYYPTNLQF